MSAQAPSRPPLSRLIGWLVGCVLVGWLIVYNVMRIDGSSPAHAATPSLVTGVIAGAAVFAVGVFIGRRLAKSGRVLRPEPVGQAPTSRT